MIQLTINNMPVEVPEGTTILHAARQAGIRIPTLCYVEGLQAIGACRVCVVEVEGARNLVASCSMPVARRHEGSDQHAARPGSAATGRRTAALRAQRRVPDLRPQRRLRTAGAGRRVGHPRRSPTPARRPASGSTLSTPGLVRDNGKCIKCRRCVSVCAETQHVGALFPQEPRLRDGHRPGLQPRPEHGGLRAVRPVRGRLPGRRDHREGPDRRGLEGARQARQARRRADRAGDSRGAGRVLRLSARHAGDRQDGRRPCGGWASTPCSTPTSPPT